jgi:large subunit ribosomal protein LP0
MPAKARSTRTKEQVKGRKADYIAKVITLLEEYPRFLFVTCDNIGSKLMQQIRLSLRPSNSVILMGKNTLIRKAIRTKLEEHPEWEQILTCVHHNVGIVLTKGSLTDLRSKLLEMTVPAIAKSGSVAPDDVLLPKQVTALEPTKTSFFAALDIATKITRGCVEILNDVKLCEKNRKVGSSEAALLQMLDIKPFTYGLKVVNCFDGSVFSPSFLDFTESDLFRSISVGIGQVAALSLALSYPTLPAFPHVIATGFKNLVAVALETKYSFKQAEALKNRVENPDAFTPVVSQETNQPKGGGKPEPKVETKVEPVVEQSEEEEDGGLSDFF